NAVQAIFLYQSSKRTALIERLVVQRTAELTRTTEQLRVSTARVRATMENVADGIFTCDAEGLIESFNPAAERIFGFKAHEVEHESIGRLIPVRREMGAGAGGIHPVVAEGLAGSELT